MDHIVNPPHGKFQAREIPDVTDEVAHALIIERLLHLELLEFIARIDDEPGRFVTGQDGLDVLLAERTRAAGDQYGFAVHHGVWAPSFICRCEGGSSIRTQLCRAAV